MTSSIVMRGANGSGPMTGSTTKQSSILRKRPWIVSLALAMTRVLAALLRARGLPTTTPK